MVFIKSFWYHKQELENEMTLINFFWILVGISVLVLIIIRFGIKKDLLTTVFWLLVGISFMVLMGIFWNVIKV